METEHPKPPELRRTLLERLAEREAVAERVVVVVAHPDDETLSAGNALRQLQRLTLVHVTDGAPRDLVDARREGFATVEGYAAARRRELDAALDALGVAPERIVALDHPDQESMHALAALALRLRAELEDADVVITHPYEHGHPDHDAAAFAVHAACALLRRERGHAPPIVEFASYHLHADRFRWGEFWPDGGLEERLVTLDDGERDLKHRAMSKFATQLSIFTGDGAADERFRIAPAYDFTRPAPPGAALYDRFGWRVTSDAWRACAAAALQELGLEGPL